MTHLTDLSMKANREVTAEDLIPSKHVIGRKYHTSWASSRGYVWILKEIRGTRAIMQTPRTKKLMITNLKDLRDINKNVILRVKNSTKY